MKYDKGINFNDERDNFIYLLAECHRDLTLQIHLGIRRVYEGVSVLIHDIALCDTNQDPFYLQSQNLRLALEMLSLT